MDNCTSFGHMTITSQKGQNGQPGFLDICNGNSYYMDLLVPIISD